MKIFANRTIWKKIVLIFMLMFSMSMVKPTEVKADLGGTLMKPVCQFVVTIGDGVMKILHKGILKQDVTMVRIDPNSGHKFASIVAGIFAALAIVGLVLLAATGIGAIASFIAGHAIVMSVSVTGVMAAATIGGIWAGFAWYNADFWEDEYILPTYSITPESIFANRIPLFNVNFFNAPDDAYYYATPGSYILPESEEIMSKGKRVGGGPIGDASLVQDIGETRDQIVKENLGDDWDWNKFREEVTKQGEHTEDVLNQMEGGKKAWNYANRMWAEINGVRYYVIIAGSAVNYGEYYYMYSDTPTATETETDSDSTEAGVIDTEKDKKAVHALSYELQRTVARGYTILRTIAIVGMMTVLVYIGIRILLSSTVNQKAKYKDMIKDWVIAIVLMFSMHYIMSFLNIFSENLTDLFGNSMKIRYTSAIELTDKVEKGLKDVGIELVENPDEATENNFKVYKTQSDDGKDIVYWNTDFMGKIRIEAAEKFEHGEAVIGHTLLYVMLIWFIISFSIVYLKRAIYLAFLTIIAPLVALTYPIDKVNDGQAQGFNVWFREYVFNLLLQPMHLLLYTVLISAAADLAGTNWIYAVVALGFIGAAEKLIRKMFNFEKAGTPGVLHGAVGLGMTMAGLKWLGGHSPKAGGAGGKGAGETGEKKNFKNKQPQQQFLPENDEAGNGSDDSGGLSQANLVLPDAEERIASERAASGGGQRAEMESDETPVHDEDDVARIAEQIEQQREQQSQNNDSQERRAPSFRDYRRAFRAGLRTSAGRTAERFKRSFKNGKPLSSLVRGAGRVALQAGLGATAAMLAGGAAIASGDPSKVVQGITGGAAIGGKLGGDLWNATGDRIAQDMDAGSREASRVLGGPDYERRQVERNQRELANSEEYVSAYQRRFNSTEEEARQMSREHTAAYLDGGMDAKDPELIAKLEAVRQKLDMHVRVLNQNTGQYEVQQITEQQIAALKKAGDRLGVGRMQGDDDRANIIQQYMREESRNGRDLSRTQAAGLVDMMRQVSDALNG